MHSRVLVPIALVGLLAGVACARSRADGAGRPSVAVEVTEVVAADLVETIETVGSLAPKRAAQIKSEYSGIVSAVHVTEWIAVREGQPLATLDARETEAALEGARAALAQAEASEVRAVREAQRAENLKQAGLMTEQGLEEARTARQAALAVTAVARAQVAAAEARLAKTVIRAPFDGEVAFRGVNVGDRVESMGGDDPMFEIVDNRLLELTMSVPSAKLGGLRVGQPVEFTVDAMPGRAFAGGVAHINPSVDPASRAAKVVAHVRNGDGALKGGLFAKARIATGTRRSVVQVPRAALRSWDVAAGTAVVFVVDGSQARSRPIRTGASAGDGVEVSSGLAPGERVATRGAFNLRDGDRVKTIPAAGD